MALSLAERKKTGISRPHVTVLTDRCAGCEECIVRCPPGALTLDPVRWVAEADDALCTGCRQCQRTCPFSAIEVEGPILVADRVETTVVRPNVLLGDCSEVRQGLPDWTTALREAERCLNCPDPTCVRGCPAHNDIPGFIGAIREHDLGLAHSILRRTSVLPDICSRVCDQASQCEGSCTWSLAGGKPVAIGALERFVTDNAAVPPASRASGKSAGVSVGIVGSGPAGIAAAWDLIEAGATVTVYEKDAEPGGLLGWGIPDFTLPKRVAARPWQELQAAGVDLRCGVEIRAEQFEELLGVHDAVIVAAGASVALRLSVPGLDLAGVIDATAFLKRAKAILEDNDGGAAVQANGGGNGDGSRGKGHQALNGHQLEENGKATLQANGAGDGNGNGRRGNGRQAVSGSLYNGLRSLDGNEQATNGDHPFSVLVLGAGNTGMDVARTARRLGAEAACVDWFDRRFAVVRADELEEALDEGVQPRFSTTLIRLEGEDGHVRRAVLARTRQDKASARPSVSNDLESVPVDLVVMAMGYRIDPALVAALPGTPTRRQATGLPDRRWLASGILASPASEFARRQPVGRLALGRELGLQAAVTPATDRVWVAGDARVGPSTVVEAMAQGRRAAKSILLTRPQRSAPGKAPSAAR